MGHSDTSPQKMIVWAILGDNEKRGTHISSASLIGKVGVP